jgi:hypothetical protein
MVKRYETVNGTRFEVLVADSDLLDSGFVDQDGAPIYVPVEDVERARGKA